ncbi:type IV pilus biogenesis protein PilP [Robbsia andropogonis]|nr:type IV pilus biogenesis protein PilP [Robbsia andropogonis]MCP1119730.1 type IV pilus biogenesis protein PilP [Robbsia andropogonis]MCP1129713.1 type IV pilus biogenesis protein PilP [Robbsia andropogonis]
MRSERSRWGVVGRAAARRSTVRTWAWMLLASMPLWWGVADAVAASPTPVASAAPLAASGPRRLAPHDAGVVDNATVADAGHAVGTLPSGGQEALSSGDAVQLQQMNAAWTPDAARRMTALEEQTMLLNAELKKLDVQQKIAQRRAEIAKIDAASQAGLASDMGGSDAAANGTRDSAIIAGLSVVAIEGLGRRYTATMQSANGRQFDVTPGDMLPGRLRVANISPSTVTIRRADGRLISLVMSSSPDTMVGLNGVPPSDAGAVRDMRGNLVPGLPTH